jgi:hypothetical protein
MSRRRCWDRNSDGLTIETWRDWTKLVTEHSPGFSVNSTVVNLFTLHRPVNYLPPAIS